MTKTYLTKRANVDAVDSGRAPVTPSGGEAFAAPLNRLKPRGTSRPYVVEDLLYRRLHFNSHAVQSAMLVDDPDALVMDYTRKMMAFLLFNPNPKHILMIGLGGGSLIKFCYRHLPKTMITVLEINADVIALRDEFCVPKDDERFRIIHDDGANFVGSRHESIDVLLIDAFDADGIAPSLAMSDFYAQSAARLTANGMIVMNLLGPAQLYVDNIRAIRRAFNRHIVLVPVMSGENVLLFALNDPPPETITRKFESLAQRLQSNLKLDFPRFLRRLCQGQVVNIVRGEPLR